MSNNSSEVVAQQIALRAIYEFRQLVQGLNPEVKLLCSKALLAKVRQMVEDLSEGV